MNSDVYWFSMPFAVGIVKLACEWKGDHHKSSSHCKLFLICSDQQYLISIFCQMGVNSSDTAIVISAG